MIKTVLNPNQKVVDAINKRLLITKGQCPCLSPEEWNYDTMCPCKVFRESGDCHCTLYIKEE